MAKIILPIAGAVLGTIIAPGAGTALGLGLGTAVGAGVGAVAGDLLTPAPKAPTPAASTTNVTLPAAPPPPTPAPTLDQTAITAATQQQAALAAVQSGRASTVLNQTMGSSGGDKLG